MISIIIPLYNERQAALDAVMRLRRVRGVGEVVLADASDEGESRRWVDDVERRFGGDGFLRVVQCARRGRAVQMNAAAARARGAVLVFLHCDTQLPAAAARCIDAAIGDGRMHGWFDVRLDDARWVFRIIERMICWRARLSGIATGDQAMYVARDAFIELGGFAEMPLMEDVELSRRLKSLGAPGVIDRAVVTSARRWRAHGVWRTIFLMWRLRLLYWLGVSPQRLAARYANVR